MTNFYVLIATDIVDIFGRDLSAFEAAEERLSANVWPIYSNTSNSRLIASGDQLVIYLAGKGLASQSFVAYSSICAVREPRRKKSELSRLAPEQHPAKVIELKRTRWFTKPVEIRPLLRSLEFIPENLEKWGAAMQSGCKKIASSDFYVIAGNERQNLT